MTTHDRPMTQAKKPFLPITNEVDDALIERIAHAKGVPRLSVGAEPVPGPVVDTSVRAGREEESPVPAGQPALPVAPVATPAPTPRARVSYIKAGIPDYAYKELALRQIEDNVTLNYLLLQGLRAIGITIADADMVEDGRRLRGRRANGPYGSER